MCLEVSAKLTEKMKKSEKTSFIFHKVLMVEMDSTGRKRAMTPYRMSPVHSAGIKRAKKPISEFEVGSSIKGRALHLYRTNATAMKRLQCLWSECFVVPVHVKKEDIIAFGDAEDVAVKKYEIKQIDWDRETESHMLG